MPRPVPVRQKQTPVVRLKRRIAHRLDEDRDKPLALRRTQKGLADALGVSKGTLHEMLNGKASGQGALARLDLIAEYLDMSPAELIQRDSSALMELSVAEQRFLRQWRNWPREVRASVLRLIDYFAALLPEEQEAREYGLLFRQLREPKLRTQMLGALRDAVRTQPKFQPNALTSAAETDHTADTLRPTPIRKQP